MHGHDERKLSGKIRENIKCDIVIHNRLQQIDNKEVGLPVSILVEPLILQEALKDV